MIGLGNGQAVSVDVNQEILAALERLKTVGWIGLGISAFVLLYVFWGRRS